MVIVVCGRFNIDFEESKEIRNIIHAVDRKLNTKGLSYMEQSKVGEIVPTNPVPIIKEMNHSLEPELSVWGFPNFNHKGIIINARSETVEEKRMFQSSFQTRRCIIPSTGFYEWDENRRKYFIRRTNGPELYMAGLYNYYEDEISRFVILTTAANESMEKIHHRMPVILEREYLEDWVMDAKSAKMILHTKMPQLQLIPMEETYEQLSLF